MTSKPVALITGCDDHSSLGAALAKCLAMRGWTVFASGLSVESMSGLVSNGCIILRLDVTNNDEITAAKAAIGHRLDLLINNAAVEGLGPLLDTDPAKLRTMYDINVFAPLAIIQAMSNILLKSRGCVVNIGSVGVYGLPFHGAYASSKAALQIISDVLRREMAPFGVSVLTVELAMVMTSMLRAENPFPFDLPAAQRNRVFARWYTELAPRYRSDIEKRYDQAVSADAAANEIVSHILAGKRGKVWVGTMAWIFRWIWPLLSTWRQDKINSDLLHMDMLLTKDDLVPKN